MSESPQISIFNLEPDSRSYHYKVSLEKLQEQLSKFGLTSNQSKVYIFLGKYGSKTAPEVCKALKMPRTETYHLLTTLQNKGIVLATFQHPIRFSALPLTRAVWSLVNAEKERVKNLERQENELTELWNNIPDYHEELNDTKEDKFQVLQGENQVHSKINEMIINVKKEFLILGSEKDFLKFYHANFLEPLDWKPIDLKFLTSSSERTMYIFDEVDRTKVKRLPSQINKNLCFVVKDDDELLFYIKNAGNHADRLTTMWTNSSSLIYSMKTLFNTFWSKSKRIHL